MVTICEHELNKHRVEIFIDFPKASMVAENRVLLCSECRSTCLILIRGFKRISNTEAKMVHKEHIIVRPNSVYLE